MRQTGFAHGLRRRPLPCGWSIQLGSGKGIANVSEPTGNKDFARRQKRRRMVETGRTHRRGGDPRVPTKGNASWLCTRLQCPPPAYQLASVIHEGRTRGRRRRLRKPDLVRSAYQTAVMHDAQRVHTSGQSHVHARRAFFGAGMTIRRVLGTTEPLESSSLEVLQDEIRKGGIVLIEAERV